MGPPEDDDALLDEVREAAEQEDPVPDEVTDAAKDAFGGG